MATVYTIWSRTDRKQVPSPDTYYQSSQAASDALRRMVGKGGNAKDKQNQTYDIESHTVN